MIYHFKKTIMTNELTTTSILALFETTKKERESFTLSLINQIESGDVDPLKIHLQIKCMEDIIKLLNSNTIYKKMLLEAAERYGKKSFEYQNAKVEIKEVGTRYDFSKCNDPKYLSLSKVAEANELSLKERETFLK